MAKAKRATTISRNTKRKVKKSKVWTYDSVFEVNPSVFIREYKDKIVIMNVEDTDNYFELNGIASQIFRSIDGTRTLESITKKVSSKSASEKQFKSKVDSLIKELIKENLIHLI